MAQDAAKLKSILSAAPVVPVIIHDDVSTARNLAEALVAGGLPNLEITLRTPNALKVMEEMAKVKGAVVGSGTVRRKKDMKASRDAGCQFMVSPGAPIALLEAAEDISIPLLPGIASPTEAMAASLMVTPISNSSPPKPWAARPFSRPSPRPFPTSFFAPPAASISKRQKSILAFPTSSAWVDHGSSLPTPSPLAISTGSNPSPGKRPTSQHK